MSKTIPLSRSYTVGSSIFESLTFREPKLADYRQLGPVYEVQNGVVVTYNETIWKYVDRLLQDTPAGALSELDLIDSLDVESGIIGFFSDAHRARSKRANSSSGSVGDQTTSTG